MTPKTRKLMIFGLTCFILLLLLALGLYIPYLKAYALVHPARSHFERTPADVGSPHYQDVTFPTSDGLTLRGWYIPSRNGAVVVFVHGHGSNRGELLGEAGLVAARGYGALLFDMRNSGESDGERTTMGLAETDDVLGAVAFVRTQPGVDPAKIGVFGHSMGAAATLLAAAQTPDIHAVITVSAYTSIEDNIADGVRALTGLPPFPFAPLVVFFGQQEARVDICQVRPVDVIARISPRAVLLIHGAQDDLITVENAQRLYAAAGEPKQLYILPNAGHANFLSADRVGYPQRILAFLEQYLPGRP